MKQLIGTEIGGYSFSAIGKTVTLTGLNPLNIEQVLMIVDATQGVIVYSPITSTKGGTISGNVLALEFDTSTYADSDSLQIFVDYPSQAPPDMTAILQQLLDAQKQTNELLFQILCQSDESKEEEYAIA